jgi:hypothetical protein
LPPCDSWRRHLSGNDRILESRIVTLDPKPPDDNRKWYGSFLITKLPVADGYVGREFGVSDHSGNQ